MRIISNTLIAVSAAALLAACGSTSESSDASFDTTAVDVASEDVPATVVELAKANPDFSTLVSAVTAAGLGETLSGDGPFTVFAPSNAAFDKVDKTALDDLMKPENKMKLATILSYHVVTGKLTASDLDKQIAENGGTAKLTTVQGEKLTATKVDDVIKLTDSNGKMATVYLADLEAANGVIHAIDTVLMPKQ